MSSQDRPIIAQFIAAGRLVNEWRDTLFYNGLLVGATVGLLSHGLDPKYYLIAAAMRETTRGFAWSKDDELQVAGIRKNRLDKSIFTGAALVGLSSLTSVLGADVILASGNGYVLLVFSLSVGTWRCGSFGGPAGVFKIYRDTMWDYPRKHGGDGDGGGTTQTQRMKDGFKSFGEKLGGLLPQPTAGLVPVRIRASPQRLDR